MATAATLESSSLDECRLLWIFLVNGKFWSKEYCNSSSPDLSFNIRIVSLLGRISIKDKFHSFKNALPNCLKAICWNNCFVRSSIVSTSVLSRSSKDSSRLCCSLAHFRILAVLFLFLFVSMLAIFVATFAISVVTFSKLIR